MQTPFKVHTTTPKHQALTQPLRKHKPQRSEHRVLNRYFVLGSSLISGLLNILLSSFPLSLSCAFSLPLTLFVSLSLWLSLSRGHTLFTLSSNGVVSSRSLFLSLSPLSRSVCFLACSLFCSLAHSLTLTPNLSLSLFFARP